MALPIQAASLNLTQMCNLRCAYCFNGEKTSKRMSLETGKKCIDFLLHETAEANINRLNGKQRQIEIEFWGGEPLIEWNMIKELVLYSENSPYKDVRVSFGGTTNGVLFTPDKFEFMQDHQIYLMVSLDGTPDTHNLYRKLVDGSGSQEIVLANTKEAIKRWPWLPVRISPVPERIDHFLEDIQYLVSNGITHIRWSPVYEAAWTDEAWITWEDQLMKTIDFVESQAKKGTLVTLDMVNQDDTFLTYPCGAGRHYVGFDVDGEIYLCHRFNKFQDQRPWQEKENCIGHIDVGITRPDLREILQNNPVKQGCPAINYDLCGTISKIPTDVRIYDMMMQRVKNYNKLKIKQVSAQQVMNAVRNLEDRIVRLEKKEK